MPVCSHADDLQGATEDLKHSPFTQTLEGSMVKASAHDCFRICVKTATTSAAHQDGRDLLQLQRQVISPWQRCL